MAVVDIALRAILTICILVFSAKLLGELFKKIRLPSVLGELFAGMLLGPYALGSLIAINGTHLIDLNEIVLAFAEIGGILILFVAGLEMTVHDFRRVGSAGFTVGTLGVIVPLIVGYAVSSLFFNQLTSMVIAAALVATSVSITSLVMQELHQSQTSEFRQADFSAW